MPNKKKPDPIPPDQARALSDYRCACRKMAALYRSYGREVPASVIEDQMARNTHYFQEIRKEVSRNGSHS